MISPRRYFAILNITIGGLLILTSLMAGANAFATSGVSNSASFLLAIGVGLFILGTLFLWPEIEREIEKVA